jgi:hypothetical protein
MIAAFGRARGDRLRSTLFGPSRISWTRGVERLRAGAVAFRLKCDEDSRAACRLLDSTSRKKRRFEPRPPGLSAKDRQLVAEHEDLELLRSIPAAEKHEQLEQAADNEVDD